MSLRRSFKICTCNLNMLSCLSVPKGPLISSKEPPLGLHGPIFRIHLNPAALLYFKESYSVDMPVRDTQPLCLSLFSLTRVV